MYISNEPPIRLAISSLAGDVEYCSIASNLEKTLQCPLPGVMAEAVYNIMMLTHQNYTLVQYGSRESNSVDWGQHWPGGQWSGILGDMLNDTIDTVIGEYTITDDRLKRFDFSVPVVYSHVAFIQRQPEITFARQTTTLLRVFSPHLWLVNMIFLIVFVVVIALSAIFIAVHENRDCDGVLSWERMMRLFGSALWVMYRTIFGGADFDMPMHKPTSKVILVVFYIFEVHLLALYTAVLLTSLLLPTMPEEAHTMSDLANGFEAGDLKFLDSGNDAFVSILRTQTTLEAADMRRVLKNDAVHVQITDGTPSTAQLVEALLQNRHYILFTNTYSAREYTDLSCELIVTQIEEMGTVRSAFIFPKNSTYVRVFNHALTREENMIDSLVQAYAKNRKRINSCAFDDADLEAKFSPLNIVAFLGAFTMFAFGSVCAFCLLVFEHFVSTRKNNSNASKYGDIRVDSKFISVKF